jgi:hypothetical protein
MYDHCRGAMTLPDFLENTWPAKRAKSVEEKWKEILP